MMIKKWDDYGRMKVLRIDSISIIEINEKIVAAYNIRVDFWPGEMIRGGGEYMNM